MTFYDEYARALEMAEAREKALGIDSSDRVSRVMGANLLLSRERYFALLLDADTLRKVAGAMKRTETGWFLPHAAVETMQADDVRARTRELLT